MFFFSVWAGARAPPKQQKNKTNPPKQQKNNHAPAPSERLFFLFGRVGVFIFCCLGRVLFFVLFGPGACFFFFCCLGGCVFFLLFGRWACVFFAVWARVVFFFCCLGGGVFFFGCLGGRRVFFCCLGAGRVFFFCLGGCRFFLFYVWAGGVFVFVAVWAGNGSSLTYRSAWLVFKRPNNKKDQTEKQKKTRVPYPCITAIYTL